MTRSVLKTVAVVAAILAVAVILTPSVRDYIRSFNKPKPSDCGALTDGATTSTMLAGITVMGEGTLLMTGAANIGSLPRKGYPITIANNSASATIINTVQLWESVDNKFIPELELKPECRNMSIAGGDCSPSSLPATLAPNASCTILISVGRPQTGYLLIGTGLGQLQIALSAHP